MERRSVELLRQKVKVYIGRADWGEVQDFARRAEVTRQTLTAFTAGKTKYPRDKTVKGLQLALEGGINTMKEEGHEEENPSERFSDTIALELRALTAVMESDLPEKIKGERFTSFIRDYYLGINDYAARFEKGHNQ